MKPLTSIRCAALSALVCAVAAGCTSTRAPQAETGFPTRSGSSASGWLTAAQLL